MNEFGHATIGIPTLGQLQTAVKALGYDVFDCIDHAKKAGVADWMDPDAKRSLRRENYPSGRKFGSSVSTIAVARATARAALCVSLGETSRIA